MRKGIPHIPLRNPKPGRQMIGRSETFEDVPLRYDGNERGIARQAGFWPTPRIIVGPAFFALDEHEQTAVLYHELHHVRNHHLETRWLFLFFFWTRRIRLKIHKQELSADAFAVSKGYGVELLRVVKRATQNGPFYPDLDFRISHLLKRIKEHENVKAVWAA